MARRTTEAEDRITNQEDDLDQATAHIKTLEKGVLTVTQKIDDNENRGRRKNIWGLGLREGIEAGNGSIKVF